MPENDEKSGVDVDDGGFARTSRANPPYPPAEAEADADAKPEPGDKRPNEAAQSSEVGGARAAASVNAGILLSRLFGLVRQRVMAHYFGTSLVADVLAAAFRVGNITQNMLGEGTLSASFIPVYTKLRAEGRSSDAIHFALSALGLLAATVALVSAVGMAAASWLSWIIAPGFDPQKLESTTRIVRVVFPMTGLLVMSAWGLGVLNAHRRFFLPYAAPVLWSAAQIVGVIAAGSWLKLRGEPLAEALAWSALAGAALQTMVLLPTARSLLGSLKPRFDTKATAVREAARRLPAALAGRGIIQISSFIDTLLVSFLGKGAVAVLAYAQTIYLLPMSILGAGEAAVTLVEMAHETAEANKARRDAALRARLGSSLARITVITVPATAAFLVLGRDITTLIFQGGNFERADTERVGAVLAVYGLALLGNASGRVLTTACYALGDTAMPARYALYRVIVSTAVAVALMRSLGVIGVVLGAVIAGWLESVALAIRIRAEIGGLGLERVSAWRIALLTAISVGGGIATRMALPDRFRATPLGSIVVLGAFGAGFLIAARALGLFSMGSLLRRR